MMWNTNILVGQSGGPTAVINSSLAGVYETAKNYGVAHVYGMKYGIEGLLKDELIDLDGQLDDKLQVELLRRTPASFLGSCRCKLPSAAADERPYRSLFALFAKYGIGAVFYIGGNDSMDTIAKLSAYGRTIQSEIRFIGVPKTIDNDLMNTDHTPGFGSAAKYIATVLKEVICDSSVYDLRSVTVAEIMGRNSGWLAGASCLAAGEDCAGPDLILLPEVPFDQDSFLARVARLEKERKTLVIAVSEGVRSRDGVLLCDQISTGSALDAFGHKAALSGTSRYLAGLIRAQLGCKTRAIELSTLQRCASHLASLTDVREAYDVGGAAVEAAHSGETGKMCAIRRLSDYPYRADTELVEISGVANLEKKVPASWIAPDGLHIAQEFVQYARPLILGEVSPIYSEGVPRHLHLR
jgi:6-phosphofructokinase 1